MDPSIMKLLEDDEDESMHSGADVEAFTAALNRDIGGDAIAAPTTQPAKVDTGSFSQGGCAVSKEPLGQWQATSEEGKPGQQVQQKEEHLRSSEQHSSQTELMQHGSAAKDQEKQIKNQSQHDQPPLQQSQSHSDHEQQQTEANSLHIVENEQVNTAEQNPVQDHKQGIAQHSGSEQQHITQQLSSQQAPNANEANNAVKRMKTAPSIPFQMLIPILRPHLDKDRSMQLNAVFAKLRNNEVSKEDFLRVIRNIVGDQMLRQAAHKLQMQLRTQAARSPQTNPNQYSLQSQASSHQVPPSGSQQFIDSQEYPLLHSSPSSQNQKARPSHNPASTVQMQTDTTFPTLDNHSQMSRENDNKSDGKGVQAAQNFPGNMNFFNRERENSISSVQAASKPPQNTQLPQTSFPMYGSTVSNFHAHPYPRPFNASATSSKPQTQDPQLRQTAHSHGMVSTHIGSTQPMNLVNIQNTSDETKKLHGGSLTSHSTSLHSSVPWQLSANKEQRISAFPSMAYVKQEVADLPAESSQKSEFAAPEGSSHGSLQINQGNPPHGSLMDENLEKQLPRMGFSSSTSLMGQSQIPGPVATQDPTVQMSSGTTPLLAGAAMRTPPKKPSAGQKKPLEAPGASPPMSSKKQKTSGAFLDQSIEQLNDVTAVSGVNLREEEEQLLSAPKEESRASEATRRVVQEEEERLILQRGPLKKKLADIMSNYRLKNISSDVERCLSMCVEERLRGLISYLIRVSKQRVDIEKARHRFVITSDVRRQIMVMNRKAKEEWDKKQAEDADKLRKLNETEGNTGADADKDKDEGRSKTVKANKEEDDKMRTTAANVAARAAVGGDDMLSKWQLMAEQARQKREGLDAASGSQSGYRRPLQSYGREQQEAEKKGPSASSASGGMRKLGRSPVTVSHPKVSRSISVKDVIAVLEREPQMSKSTLIYRLYGKLSGEAPAE